MNRDNEMWIKRAVREDGEFIERGKMRDAIWSIPIISSIPSGGNEDNEDVAEALYRRDVFDAIDSLPASARSVEEIEKVIENLDQLAITGGLRDSYLITADTKEFKKEIGKLLTNLLRWILNQKQETWTDEELLGKEKDEQGA